MTATQSVDDMLAAELRLRQHLIRPPSVVMSPAMLGAARLTRYSFSRMLIRAAVRGLWTARRTGFEMDEDGQGEAVYEWQIDDDVYSFVAFTQTLDESAHTDRVIAERWEISGALVEGRVDDGLMDMLRREIPAQENGRLDPRVLVLTRGNRSVRFFEYLVDTLAAGNQPDPDLVADAGYILRSTAFYANGKFGMKSYGGYPAEHPFAVPYRAQFAAALLFRELGYDLVEHCARVRGGDRAVRFDLEWSRYFGLGNATGLGLVPYAFKHPRVLNTWVAVRELALAGVRATEPTEEMLDKLDWWIDRARRHFSGGTSDDCTPFLSPVELTPMVEGIAAAFGGVRAEPDAFDRLHQWAEIQHPEVTELVVSLLIELHEGDDEVVDRMLRVDEHAIADPTMTASEILELIGERFDWLDSLDLDSSQAKTYWWVISDNTEEPRRAPRERIAPRGRDVAIDIALRIAALRDAARAAAPDALVCELIAAQPELQLAADRLVESDRFYGEPRDNACAQGFLPLQLQRFQLAFYGMDNFKPKSTDWLRVTLFQGAPRIGDLTGAPLDDWVLPPVPTSTTATTPTTSEERSRDH